MGRPSRAKHRKIGSHNSERGSVARDAPAMTNKIQEDVRFDAFLPQRCYRSLYVAWYPVHQHARVHLFVPF